MKTTVWIKIMLTAGLGMFGLGINPVRAKTDAFDGLDHIIVIYQENWSFDALYGCFPGANGIAHASANSLNQVDRVTGKPISSLAKYDPVAKDFPTQIPPVPLYTAQDSHFLTDTNNPNSPSRVWSLLPYDLAPYLSSTNLTGDLAHRYWQEQFQIDGGKMDKFVTWSDNPGLVMSYFDASTMPEGQLAAQFTLCDNYFHSAFGGSFLNHQFLIAAAPPVYPDAAGLQASNIATLDASGLLVLNATNHRLVQDGKLTPIGGVSYVRNQEKFDTNYAVNTIYSMNLAPTNRIGDTNFGTFLPSLNDSNPNDPVRPYQKTIGDLMDAAGVTWKWYSGGWDRALTVSASNPANRVAEKADPSIDTFQWHHQPFAYFDNYAPWTNRVYWTNRMSWTNQVCWTNRVCNSNSFLHLQDENNFFADVSNNTLPQVVFLKALGIKNEHPNYSTLLLGQQYVTNIVAAVQSNPKLWAHTAIIVTYDENGGRWDHVGPRFRDRWGPGTRVPAIVISPLARTHFVDHTEYDTSSILRTIEMRFKLGPLNERDRTATPFTNAFNIALTGSPDDSSLNSK